ncbi:MAG: hypothetical protein ACE5GM_10355 [bacterium]
MSLLLLFNQGRPPVHKMRTGMITGLKNGLRMVWWAIVTNVLRGIA